MKKVKLTDSQQNIIDSLTAEFAELNTARTGDVNDIFAYIDSTVNEKKRLAEEISRNNRIMYEKASCLAHGIIADVQPILDKYNFKAEALLANLNNMRIHFTSPVSRAYAQVYINFSHCTVDSLIKYTDIVLKYDNKGEIDRDEVSKFFANFVISELKSVIQV